MSSSSEFIQQSLGLHLFFARIMKEHSFFLEAAFTQRDASFIQKADDFRKEFDEILRETIAMSNGVVSPSILQSGEVITPYTLDAELATAYLTGVQFSTELTKEEEGLMGGGIIRADQNLEQGVYMLNQRAMNATYELIQFKTDVLSYVTSCHMYTFNYPLLIVHITREAELYLQELNRLQTGNNINMERDAYDLELFWNRQMGEHAKFIRGLLDPTEDSLIRKANNFGNEFDQLTLEARAAMDATAPVTNITYDSLQATEDLRDFKAQGTQGILACKISSIIVPLLGDHVLREANHYIRLLKTFERR